MVNPGMIPTPVVDEAEFRTDNGQRVVPAELARRLERALADPQGHQATASAIIKTLRDYYHAQKAWDARADESDPEKVAKIATNLARTKELVEDMEATIREVREGELNPNVVLPKAH